MIMSSFVVVSFLDPSLGLGKTSSNSASFVILLHADGSVHLIRCAVVWNVVDLGCEHLS
jgi:hypothetical protein